MLQIRANCRSNNPLRYIVKSGSSASTCWMRLTAAFEGARVSGEIKWSTTRTSATAGGVSNESVDGPETTTAMLGGTSVRLGFVHHASYSRKWKMPRAASALRDNAAKISTLLMISSDCSEAFTGIYSLCIEERNLTLAWVHAFFHIYSSSCIAPPNDATTWLFAFAVMDLVLTDIDSASRLEK